MNTLFINTSSSGQVIVKLSTEKKEFEKVQSQQFGSQVLLDLITQILKEADIDLHDLDEIQVATGPGSYTGLRVGVAVANALGFALGIPVNGKKMETDLVYS